VSDIYYRAFGSSLISEVALPGLIEVTPPQAPDICVHCHKQPALYGLKKQRWFCSSELAPSGRPWITVWRLLGDGGYYLQFGDGIEFSIDGSGSHIWSAELSGATAASAATYLLGIVLGLALYLRGLTCLHASAVVVDGKAVLFAGDAGGGKSSLAALFALHGYPVLTDDVVALQRDADELFVQPALPYVRLRPHLAETFFGRSHTLPRISPDWDKYRLALDGTDLLFASQPAAPALIYLLAPQQFSPGTERFTSLPARDALFYLSNLGFLPHLMDKEMHRAEFEVLSLLLRKAEVRLLPAVGDPGRLDELFPVLLADIRRKDPRVRTPAAQ
jgi:hypothetical protein